MFLTDLNEGLLFDGMQGGTGYVLTLSIHRHQSHGALSRPLYESTE